jgi:hypothetical protein
MRDTDIGLGDVVRAWDRLGARTPQERAHVANLLGFDYGFQEGDGAADAESTERAAAAAPAAATAEDTRSKIEDPEPGAAPSIPLPLARVSKRSAESRSFPDWLRIDEPLQPELPQHLELRLPHQPLFRAGWTRAILSAACAAPLADGPIDIARLVDSLARCLPISELPREPLLSLGRGIELLIDRGDSLMPFARDVRELQQQLRLVVGRDRTRIRYFDGCPTLGSGPGARSTWVTRYQLPASQTPIVVVTDLGMARGGVTRSAASEDAWLQFFGMTKAASCPVVVFAPYPLARWPRVLARAVRAIPWDLPTTVSLVRQTARHESSGG